LNSLFETFDNKITYNQSVDLKLNAYYTSGGPFYGPWKM